MPKTSRYYLGRIVRLGSFSEEQFLDALLDSATVKRRKFQYTLIDVSRTENASGTYFFGKLAKYLPRGEVEVVQPEQHAEGRAEVPNILIAASPFIFIPEYSGIAYQHVWNQIQREQFEQIFPAVIKERFDGFFFDCAIEPISDLRTFVQRLSRFTRISKLEATVHPSNPFFGPAWRSLREYMRERSLSEAHFREEAASSDGLNTSVHRLAERVLGDPSAGAAAIADAIAPDAKGLTDAAVLMAADGYGRAKVEGEADGVRLRVRTEESQLHVDHDADPDPEDLFREVRDLLESVSRERQLGHLESDD